MGFQLSPRAQLDIDEIWNYTEARWGLDQAERYIGLLRDAVESVAEFPGLGRPCGEIRAGYFRITAGAHVTFYRIVGANIDVVRVLHGRMDVRRHL
jgi:toxin ParE1/3/4